MQDLLLMLLLTLGGSGRSAGAAPPAIAPSGTVVSASPVTAPSVVGAWRGEWSAPARHGAFQARMIHGLKPGTVYAEFIQDDGGAARVSRREGHLTADGVRFAVPGGEIVLTFAGNDRLEGTLVTPAGATVALTRVQR